MSTLRPLPPGGLKNPLEKLTDPFKLKEKLEDLLLNTTPRIYKPPALKISTAWEYKTGRSNGISVGYGGISGGEIVLEESSTTLLHTFTYGGVGPTVGGRIYTIPRLGKLEIPTRLGKLEIPPVQIPTKLPTSKGPATGTLSFSAFPSWGAVYARENLPGGDLTLPDIKGLCLFIEAGGGVVGGGSTTAMCVGLNPMLLTTFISPTMAPIALLNLIDSMKGIICIAGVNMGIQGGLSGGGYLGWLY